LIYPPELEVKETTDTAYLSCGRVIYRVEKSNVLMEDT
jgi:hypothetical protein